MSKDVVRKPELKVSPSSWSAYSELIHYQQIEWEVCNLVGRVLTIVDSSIQDTIQRKAMKDLVRSAFRETFDRFQSEASNGKAGHSVNALIN